MPNHSDPAPDELVELAERPVRTHWHDDGDGRKVVTLAEHLELNDAVQVARVAFEAFADRADLTVGHRVVEISAGDPVFLGDPCNLGRMTFSQGGEEHSGFYREQQLTLGVESLLDDSHDLSD